MIDSGNSTNGVRRVTDVLVHLGERHAGVGVTELSRELGFAKSVTHRILSALVDSGFVELDETDKKYRLGYRAVQLGAVALSNLDVRSKALSQMKVLRDETLETVNLSLRLSDSRVYIESMESPQEIRQRVELGRPMPLHLGASSKAMLAYFTESDLENCLSDVDEKVTASGAKLSRDLIESDLKQVRIRGYAVSLSERLVGAFSIAAPIFDHRGEVIGSLSISGPQSRWTEPLTQVYGRRVRDACSDISRKLGFVEHESRVPNVGQWE
jgi:DNA-binding IclR family transcriptional regulator